MDPQSSVGRLKMIRRLALGVAIVMFLIWIGGSMVLLDAGAEGEPADWFIIGAEIAKAIMIVAAILYLGSSFVILKRKGGHGIKQLFPLHNPKFRPLIMGLLYVAIVGGPILLVLSGLAIDFVWALPCIVLPIGIMLIMFPSFPILTGSMIPSLKVGDSVLGERFGRVAGRPCRRGEIVTFTATREILKFIPTEVLELLDEFSPLYGKLGGIGLCKRVVGVAGDRVEITGGLLYVNGDLASEEWGRGFDYEIKRLSDIGHQDFHPYIGNEDPIVVPPGQYFVLGDLREGVNLDSHVFGFVKHGAINGRLLNVFWRDGRFASIPLVSKDYPVNPEKWSRVSMVRSAVGVAVLAAALCFIPTQFLKSGMDHKSMKEMHGTWEDPKGPPGNYIQFETVPHVIKGTKFGEGKVEVNKLLGFEHEKLDWGYNTWEPILRISLIKPQEWSKGLKVKALDHHRIVIKQIKASTDTDDLDWYTQPDALTLRRTREPQYKDFVR